MNNFFTRAASGLTVAALVIAAILASRISYGIVILIAVVGGMYEFYTISAPIRHTDDVQNKKSRRTAVVLTVIAVIFSLIFNLRYNFADAAVILPAILFFYFVRGLFSHSESPFEDIAWGILPFIYIVFPVMLLNYLYFEKGELFALSILFMIWFYDSMCYICGSLVGRTKLFERISPHKTVEGMVGGMILTLILVFFYDKILGFFSVKYHFHCYSYTNVQWLFIGFVTLVFATLGDLIESQLKRNIGIKDSGSILPGHGGFLDRLDAILVAIPFTVLVIFFIDRINDALLLIDFLK